MEFLESFLAGIGGATVVILAVITFGKGLIQKWIEKAIDSSFEKKTIKYTDTLSRKTKAYEMLLDKEMLFFEKTSLFTAGLIVNIQDACSGLFDNRKIESKEERVDNSKKAFLTILQDIIKYKSESLEAQSFISDELFTISSNLISRLQADSDSIFKILKRMSEEEEDISEEEKNKLEDIEKEVLITVALLMKKIKNELTKMSES